MIGHLGARPRHDAHQQPGHRQPRRRHHEPDRPGHEPRAVLAENRRLLGPDGVREQPLLQLRDRRRGRRSRSSTTTWRRRSARPPRSLPAPTSSRAATSHELKQTIGDRRRDQAAISAAASVAVAVGVGIYDNTAKATVDGGAQLNAGGTVGVESTVSYPILLANPLTSINPLDYLSGGNTTRPPVRQRRRPSGTPTTSSTRSSWRPAIPPWSAWAERSPTTSSTTTPRPMLEPGALVNQDDDSGQATPPVPDRQPGRLGDRRYRHGP